MAGFGQFGVAHPDKEEKRNESLNYEFSLVPDDFKAHSLYDLIEEGVYNFTVCDCAPTDDTKNGFKRMKVELSIDYKGQEARVSDNLMLSSNTTWRIGQFFKCLGMDEEIMKNGGKVTMDTWHATVGRTGKFENKHREYNGKMYNNVAKYIAPGEKAVR